MNYIIWIVYYLTGFLHTTQFSLKTSKRNFFVELFFVKGSIFVILFWGVMNRVRSSRTTAPDCPHQPLTAWKSKVLSVTALSQSVSHITERTFSTFPQRSAIVLFFQYFDSNYLNGFKRMIETYTFTNLFTCFAKVYPANYFAVWIRKHDTDISVNFHYYCLLLIF